MEDWVRRALAKWPNVPALYGWLGLDRRGRWLIRGEPITRPQIIDTINRNYAADERGCWYFQNGPQRGYVQLAYAPLILRRVDDSEVLWTHTGRRVDRPERAWLDEEGSLLLQTEHGPGLLDDAELDWALQRLRGADGSAVDEDCLADALQRPAGADAGLSWLLGDTRLAVRRLDAAGVPDALGFVREPESDAVTASAAGDPL